MTRTRKVLKSERTVQLFILFGLVLTSIQGHVLEFSSEPRDTVVESGSSAVLDCAANSSEFPQSKIQIQWYDQHWQLLAFLGDMYRSQLTNGSLYISRVLEDQGTVGSYHCSADLNQIGSIVSRTATVSLASLSGFAEEPRDISVFAGQKSYFACRVQATPAPRVRWLKDERPLQLDELRMTVLPSGALEIDEVQYSDQGTYRCNASGLNQYRLSNKAALMLDTDQDSNQRPSSPSFIAQPRTQEVIEGQTITLDCAANGSPKPWISWLKDGVNLDMADLDSRYRHVGGTSSLQIINIQESDEGMYQCRASNREDSFDATAIISVLVPPKFIRKPHDMLASENNDTELECSIYGKPEPKIQWLKNGEVITYNEYINIFGGHNLRILGLMEQDAGIFQCVGSNVAGNVQASARLKITKNSKPDQVSPQKSYDNLGDILPAYPAPPSSYVGKQQSASAPGQPHDLKAVIVKARFVTLSWKQPDITNGDILAYSVFYRQEGSQRERVQNTTQNTTRPRLEEANIASLIPSRVYYFRVVAYNLHGPGPSSETLKIITQSEEHVPSAPLALIAFATSATSVHIQWTEPEVSNGVVQLYKIYYMENDGSFEHNIDTTNLSYELTALAMFTEYSIWVVGVNQNGAGASSREATVRTFSAAPTEAPYNVTVEPASSTSVTVRWEPPPIEGQNGIITGYKIRYRKQSRKGDTITTPGNSRMHTLSALERSSIYQIRLCAINVNGTGPPTDWFTVTTYENDLDEHRVPEEPSPLKVKANADSITVSWVPLPSQNVKIRKYILGWGKGIPDNYMMELDEKQRGFLIKNLEANSEYVISLRASNNVGPGPARYANVRTRDEVSPDPMVPLLPPVGLKAHVISSNAVVLYWTDATLSKSQFVTDNRYYVVQYGIPSNLKARFYNSSDLNCMIVDLKANTLYEFTVKVVRGRRESPWSMVVQNTTLPASPSSPPRDLSATASEQNHQVVLVSWLPPKMSNGPITGYILLYTMDNTKKDRDWLVEGIMGDKHMIQLATLEPLTTYYFKIQARNSKGNGPFSQAVSFRTSESTGIDPRSLKDKNNGGPLSGTMMLYLIIGGSIIGVTLIAVIITVVCCRRRDPNTTPDRTKKGYQKGMTKNQSIKPPDLWIHHDQMELKALEKGHSSNDGASSSGAMTLPRSVGANEYDPHDSQPTNSLDKRTYVPSYMGASPDDKSRRVVKPKPITIPVEAKCGLREPTATTTTPMNTTPLSQAGSSDLSGLTSRPPYPRTQYTISRAHVTIDQNALVPPGVAVNTAPAENPYAMQSAYDTVSSAAGSYVGQPQPTAPPTLTYAPGMMVDPGAGGKRLQGHPLKSFSVPAPPPTSAPGTPQPKHVVRPNSSPYKKVPPSGTAPQGTPTSRISAVNPPPHTTEEVQRLAPSYSTEELNQEMANLEGLMKDLNAITASEFEMG